MKTRLAAVCLTLTVLLCACSLPSGYTDPTEKLPSPSVEAQQQGADTDGIPKSGLLTEGLKAHTIHAPAMTDAFVSSMAEFSTELFARCAQSGENTVLSPMSAHTALGMAALGADGETLKQLEKLLGAGESLPETLTAYRALLDRVTQDKGGSVVRLANSVWFDTARVTPVRAFLQDNVDWFNSDVFSEDFSNTATADAINGWVSDKTERRIDRLVDEIQEDTVLFLINAVYLDAKWALPFGEAQEGTFKTPGGKVKAEMMSVTKQFGVLENAELKGVALPYDDGVHSFLALLPKKDKPLEGVVKKLEGNVLGKLLEGKKESAVTVTLPKFKTESTVELSETLKEMGIASAFDPSQADFTRLGTSPDGNIFVSSVLQKAYISVDEAGTEAAAATSVTAQITSAIVDPAVMRFDRPFLYAVVENETGLPLFIGALNNPAV